MMQHLAAGHWRPGGLPFRIGAAVLTGMLAVAVFQAGVSAAEPALQVEGIQARLFYSKTGTFSDDILAKEPQRLGNVTVGEKASVSTFVTVKVRLLRGDPRTRELRVRLVVTESPGQVGGTKAGSRAQRVILDQTMAPGPPAADGISHVGFWLPSTGCNPLKLTASIPGVPEAKAEATLGFACYE
jgi:hypothetical protein